MKIATLHAREKLGNLSTLLAKSLENARVVLLLIQGCHTIVSLERR